MLGAASAATAEEVKAPAVDPAPEFDRAAWLADYDGLKATMARGYANLDWIVAHRGLDLAALDRATTAKLEAAESVPEAVAAISAFTEAFGDNHLRGAILRARLVAVLACGRGLLRPAGGVAGLAFARFGPFRCRHERPRGCDPHPFVRRDGVPCRLPGELAARP